MRKIVSLLLQLVILVIIALVLWYMVWFPQAEGRAANLDLIRIYTDPLIIYGYIASIPFFVGIYQVFKLIEMWGNTHLYSINSIKRLNAVKYSSLVFVLFIIGALAYIRLVVKGDDPAGPTMLGFITIVIGFTVGFAAHFLQKRIYTTIKK